MRLSTLVKGTAGTAVVALGALAVAPQASAVTPTAASVEVDCGYFYGSGKATLEAEQNGDEATLRFTTPVAWAHHSFPENEIASTLTLTTASGEEVTLTGQSNPAWVRLGQPFDSGPLTGTVPVGEELEFTSITAVFSGTVVVNCTALAPQEPEPFVF